MSRIVTGVLIGHMFTSASRAAREAVHNVHNRAYVHVNYLGT